ncbi:twitching motility protein PilT [Bacteroidia bacterium]|nr:twitching motility protein PilT [Bacteroidia bacterium]
MRYLIDTNIFLFYAFSNHLLDDAVRQIIENYENSIYISSESVKEVIHLLQSGKIKTKMWKSANDIFENIENVSHCTIKYVNEQHLRTFAALDRVENHNDPSDRLIIAQAITKKLPLISSDRKFEHYRKQKLNFIYRHCYVSIDSELFLYFINNKRDNSSISILLE